MDKNNNSVNYSCPFTEVDCLYMDSLSITKMVIGDDYKNHIRPKIKVDEINRSVSGFRKPMLNIQLNSQAVRWN